VNVSNYDRFTAEYPELAQNRIRIQQYRSTSQLGELIGAFDISVATTNNSMGDVAQARQDAQKHKNGAAKIAYFVLDYEPLFYSPHSEQWKTAYASYTLMNDAVLFAKTDWIRETVYANHGVRVHKVSPSIDHDIYFPNLSRQVETLSIVAMLRPATPRRAPKRTIRILEILADEFPQSISLQVFGVKPEDLESAGLSLSSRIVNHGVLTRQNVPRVMRTADMFLDLSDFQAFGRTALESMACGCIPTVPVLGGTAEFAVDSHNAYVVDTRSDDAILEAARRFIALRPDVRMEMRQNALETASNFTIAKAALSELRLFCEMVNGE
jgi:glycosyltransferase involved in cell wall biosynthesis